MPRGTAKFAHKTADQERIADFQQMLLAQCELVIWQTEIVAAQSKVLSQRLLNDGRVTPLPSLRATLETKLGPLADNGVQLEAA